MDCTDEKLSNLIVLNLGDLDEGENRKWSIGTSSLGGRGLFAIQDIRPGEIVFREKPLLIGPTGRRQQLNYCVICNKSLENLNNSSCSRGCSLPVCAICSNSNEHLHECDLYRSWEPIDPFTVSYQGLKLLTIARGLFVEKYQKDLIYILQANNYAKCKIEILNCAKAFRKFPIENVTISYFGRILAVLNTVAFETIREDERGDISARGLYPLAGTMNHNCLPNTCHPIDNGNIMFVKATRFIPKGSELTASYTSYFWSNISRRLFLKATKDFMCNCGRCSDPTENGTLLSGLFCRESNCNGIVIPLDSLIIEAPWQCLKCQKIYDWNEIFKLQDFILAAITSKINNSTVEDAISFINDKIPKFCPTTNQFAVEAKLTIIWKMKRLNSEHFTERDYRCKIQYCKEILEVLNNLGAGECTIKELLQKEIQNTMIFLQ